MEQGHVTADATELAHRLNDFGWRLYRALPKSGSCFLSPMSIAIVLAALMEGAHGDTRAELANLLGVSEEEASPRRIVALLDALAKRRDRASGITLRIATGLFVRSGYPIRSAYQQTLESAFRADLMALDFDRAEDAAARINQWVSDRTRERINQIVYRGHITPLSRLIFANAVYFFSPWEVAFAREDTRQQPFSLLPGSRKPTVDVPMMRRTGWMAVMLDPRGFSAVRIPYRAMEMIVLLPEEGKFAEVHKLLDAQLVVDVIRQLQPRTVALELPRFELRWDGNLRDAGRNIGLDLALDPQRADFGRMSDDPSGLVLSSLLHASRVAVDETGTEAAAVTAAMILAGGAVGVPAPAIPFRVDRPFFFVIRDERTHAILFIGRVTNPMD